MRGKTNTHADYNRSNSAIVHVAARVLSVKS